MTQHRTAQLAGRVARAEGACSGVGVARHEDGGILVTFFLQSTQLASTGPVLLNKIPKPFVDFSCVLPSSTGGGGAPREA